MNHRKLAESEKSGREFNVVREQPVKRKKKLEEKHTHALIHYRGDIPARLATATFNSFDGERWTNKSTDAVATDRPVSLHHDTSGKPWIAVDQTYSAASSSYEKVAVRWLGLDSNRVTTPDRLSAVHIDRIDREDFFAWTQDDIIEMCDRDRIPIFTTLVMKCSTRPGPAIRHYRHPSDEAARSNEPIGIDRTTLESILESWIRDCDTDHARIEAIIARLRSDFVLDPSAPTDESAASPVEGFLKSKRGPAYLFATTAACLFRSIGLESRVATGFYIDGDDFDRESSHYAATSDSYHWWVQIQLTDGSWLSLEPTPGYDPTARALVMARAIGMGNCLGLPDYT